MNEIDKSSPAESKPAEPKPAETKPENAKPEEVKAEKPKPLALIKEGDVHPTLGKKVTVLNVSTDKYCVFLDDEFDVQWQLGLGVEFPSNSGSVLNRVSQLEGWTEFLRGHPQFKPVRAMLGEAVARLLNGGTVSDANSILDAAVKIIELRNQELSRRWFNLSAFSAVLVAALVVYILISWWAACGCCHCGEGERREIALVVLMGAVGALSSILLRGGASAFDANAGLSLHIIEGYSRVVTGMIAAGLMMLSIKGGIIAINMGSQGCNIYVVMGLGIASGASERAMTSFIKRAEGLLANS